MSQQPTHELGQWGFQSVLCLDQGWCCWFRGLSCSSAKSLGWNLISAVNLSAARGKVSNSQADPTQPLQFPWYKYDFELSFLLWLSGKTLALPCWRSQAQSQTSQKKISSRRSTSDTFLYSRFWEMSNNWSRGNMQIDGLCHILQYTIQI